MPRGATFKPTQVKSKKGQGVKSWCLNVPANLSPTGKRQRLFYATKLEAAAACERLQTRKENFGISLSSLSPARLAEAAEAFRILDPVHVPLLEVVRNFMAAHKLRSASVTFHSLFDVYLEAKSDRSPKYLDTLQDTLNRFPSLHDRMVSDIRAEDLEPLLATITPGGRNAVMRYLRAVFFYAIKRGYMVENPIAKLDFSERKRKEVETIPSDKVQDMLMHALEHDLPLLPYLVFGFFCGVRPDGELQKILWDDIKLAERTIVIRPEVSKTNRRRFPKISANAEAWIETYRQRGGTFEGKVSAYKDSNVKAHRRKNRKAVGITKWVQQGMRHTFCSNWLAKHKDINELVLQSGHDSVDTMWRNYHKGVTPAEAEAFWSIMPPPSENVIAFRQA